MELGKVIVPVARLPLAAASPAPETEPAGDFAAMLGRALDRVRQAQVLADDGARAVAMGLPVDLHDVVLASEQATLLLQLATQVRNRALEAYLEIIRMPL